MQLEGTHVSNRTYKRNNTNLQNNPTGNRLFTLTDFIDPPVEQLIIHQSQHLKIYPHKL